MRWTLLLLLAVACTHSQPPPAPLSVPPEAAARPAGAGLPDGGVIDAGSAMPDAGSPAGSDAGAPRADLVSPITAAGSETPTGLDWGEKGDQPARTLFKNVKLLGDLTGNRFMAGMQSMKANLGQRCVFCHLVREKDFPSDARKEKLRAREMIRMTSEINQRTFRGEVQVTCWTCHRGDEKPVARPFAREVPQELSELTEARLEQPAEVVFKDVRQLKGMKARHFAFIMGWFSRELGVKCAHCHKTGDFAADHEKKTRAREMLEMTSYVAKGYYNNDSPVACGTCHAGQVKPPRTPADKS